MQPLRFRRLDRFAPSLLALVLATSGCFDGARHPVPPQQPTILSFTAPATAIVPGGSATLSWSVTGADTLSIGPDVGTVTGTSVSVTPAATTTYTLSATSVAGTSTASATVTVLQPPTGLAYLVNPAVYAVGSAVRANTPSYVGGAIVSWTVSPALPAGLSLGPTTGIVTGTPTAEAAQATYAITGTNAAGSTTAELVVTVTPRVDPPANLSYSSNPATYAVGVAIAANSPSSTGGPISAYGVSPALPGGLSLDGATGVVTGTPSAAATQADYTVTGSNASGSTPVSLRITVTAAAPPVITTQPTDQAVAPPATATFTVVATDPGTITYQWQKNGTAIPGATAASYTTPATTSTDGGSLFRVVVSNAAGASVTSNAATLRVQGFLATGPMATGRVGHTATRLTSGKVLVTGGSSGTVTLRSAELYDPVAGTFTDTGSMFVARQLHSATLLPDGKVLVSGGYSGSAYLPSAEIYDPTLGSFSPTTNDMPEARMDFASVLVGSKVLIAGGFRQTPGGSQLVNVYLSTAVLFDVASMSFGASISMNAERRGPTASLLPGGTVLVAGGRGTSGVNSSAEIFDPVASTFAPTGAMASRREDDTATTLAGGAVLVAGGYNGANDVATAELYGSGAFSSTTGPMGTPRALHTASLLADGRVLVAGGVSGASILGTAEFYDPAAGTFAPATGQNLGTPRSEQTATPLDDGRVLVVGGRGANGVLSSAELFTPVP